MSLRLATSSRLQPHPAIISNAIAIIS